MDITDVTEFRIYVELARRKRQFITNTQAEYDKYEQQSLTKSEIEHRASLRTQINKAKEELTILNDILDKKDDDSEYLYTQEDIGERADLTRPCMVPHTNTFIIKEVTNYHGLTQLLIETED